MRGFVQALVSLPTLCPTLMTEVYESAFRYNSEFAGMFCANGNVNYRAHLDSGALAPLCVCVCVCVCVTFKSLRSEDIQY